MPESSAPKPALTGLAFLIDQTLPQTQCTRCGYPDCAAYAQAIAAGEAAINQCPPGGQEGVLRLAALTGQPVQPLNAQFGIEGPLTVARIDEDWCIGCTLCIKACPVDAILGASKYMHTVMAAHCTGCELCIPVCPVDCIELDVLTPGVSGWQAWSQAQAMQARQRYARHQARQTPAPAAPQAALPEQTEQAEQTEQTEQTEQASAKASAIARALAKARARRTPQP